MRSRSILCSAILAMVTLSSAVAAFPWLLQALQAKAGRSAAQGGSARGLRSAPDRKVSPGKAVVLEAEKPILPMEATTPTQMRDLIRSCAAATLSQIDELRAGALCSSDPLVSANAIRALGQLGAMAAEPEALRLLSDPRLRVRQEAVVALGLGADPGAIEMLEPLLEREDPTLRPLVIQALGRIGGPRARDLIQLQLGNASVR